MTAEKYRIYAAQCMLLAGEMRDPDHKAGLVAMARAWTRLGDFIDAQRDPPAFGGQHGIRQHGIRHDRGAAD